MREDLLDHWLFQYRCDDPVLAAAARAVLQVKVEHAVEQPSPDTNGPVDCLSLASAEAVTPMFLRMPTVMRMTGLGRSTIYRLIAERKFPSPVRLGPRAVAWRSSDLDEWSEARPVVSH